MRGGGGGDLADLHNANFKLYLFCVVTTSDENAL